MACRGLSASKISAPRIVAHSSHSHSLNLTPVCPARVMQPYQDSVQPNLTPGSYPRSALSCEVVEVSACELFREAQARARSSSLGHDVSAREEADSRFGQARGEGLANQSRISFALPQTTHSLTHLNHQLTSLHNVSALTCSVTGARPRPRTDVASFPPPLAGLPLVRHQIVGAR